MNRPINILLIEDNSGDVTLVQEILNQSKDIAFNLLISDDLAKSFKLIASENIHAILLDLNLPDSEGLETFRQIHRFSINVPIIIISGLSDAQLIYQTMKEGAQAYLIKGQIENESLIRNILFSIWSNHAP